MKKPIISFALLFTLLFVSACSGVTGGSLGGGPQDADPAKTALTLRTPLTDLNRDKFSSYSSTFLVQFDGDSSWKYQLRTRKSAALREINLHIEGLEKSANPGDIRLVTDGTTSWMIGPGTEGECVQFPNNQGMDPTLLYPEVLLPAQNLTGLLQYKGEEPVAGIAGMHYVGSAPAIGDWKDAQVEVWQDKASRGLLRFTMQAFGKDSFFGKGSGKLSAQYEAAALDVAKIEPVKGCEISVPLPDAVGKLVRLPGMASFESSARVEDVRAFYQAQLPQGNWTEKEPPEQTQDMTVLSYQRNDESVEIQIKALATGGSAVKLIFLQGP